MSKKNTPLFCLILLLIIISGGYLRFSSIGFGLPNYLCKPDETAIIDNAIKVASGKLNPKFFKYPTFQIYLNTVLFGIYFVAGYITGHFASVKDFIAEYVTNPSNLYIISRCFSAFFGTASIYAAYRITTLTDDKKAGLAAAFLLATNYLHARDSHFAVTDIFMTFMICAAFYYILKASITRERRDYLAGAVLTGLAASVKYNAGVLAFVFIFAFIYAEYSETKELSGIAKNRYLYIYPAVILLAFFAASPYILLDFGFFLSEFMFQLDQMKGGHLGIDLGSGLIYHIKFSLYHGLGPFLLVTSALSLIFLAVKRNRQYVILLFYIAVFYFFMGKGKSVFARYMLPLIPFLCVSSGIFLSRMADALNLAPRKRIFALIMAAALLAASPASRVISTNRLLAQKDTRSTAEEYIAKNIAPGSNILLTSYFGSPMLRQSVSLLKKEYDHAMKTDPAKSHKRLEALIGVTEKGAFATYNVFMATSVPNAAKSEFSYNITKDDLIRNEIKYVVLGRYFLEHYELPAEFVKLIEQNGKLLTTISPIDDYDKIKGPVFDPIDLFYLPIDGFNGFSRPGPYLMIYEMQLT